ncbi:MAG TPA: M20/M25/M40 family metallo-hydrolase [Thermoanaerobaculia bacterium]|nr:M20/M25/M40 family metallo-hydrolase [Thermoanaerobaculia bacterium]
MADRDTSRGEGGERSGSASGWPLPALVVLVALLLLLVVDRGQPPAPSAASAPASEFSAGRAHAVLAELLGDGQPHPLGSAANRLVRDRILARLTALGYSPRLEEGFACYHSRECGRVENVVARLAGREPDGGAVLLACHYDSVPAGPGASDNMTGVAAVLEVARALKADPQPRNSVVLLIDDGEEGGLLGATAFAESSPEAAEIKVVVNVDARGTAGPSLMFETGVPNGWVIPLWARAAKNPATTSVAATVYSYLPNDTDLTVFKRHHLPGLNFAFLDNPAYYHTPLDNLANASPASLQHHGDNALAAVRGLAGADLLHPPAGDLVFFSVLGLGVVRWPVGWTPVLAVLALALVLAVAVRALRRGTLRGGALAAGIAAPLLVLAAVWLAAYALHFVLQTMGALRSNWLAHPLPAVAAFWLAALALVVLLGGVLTRWAGALGVWAGVWIILALAGLLLALSLPGLSYPFLLTALAAGIAGLAAGVGKSVHAGIAASTAVAMIVGALLWFPVLMPLYTALGIGGLQVIAALVAVALLGLAPLAGAATRPARRFVGWAAVAGTLIAAVAAMTEPTFSAASPQPLNLVFHQDADSRRAHWLASQRPLPPVLRRAGGFALSERPFPWAPPGVRWFSAPAPVLAAEGPRLTVAASSADGGKRRLRLHMSSPRGAAVATLYVPVTAKLESITIEGRPVLAPETILGSGTHLPPPQPGSAPGFGWYAFTDLTLPAGGCDVEAVLGESGPLDWYVSDRTPGLPPSGRALLAARPVEATPIQDGDVTIFTRKVTI